MVVRVKTRRGGRGCCGLEQQHGRRNGIGWVTHNIPDEPPLFFSSNVKCCPSRPTRHAHQVRILAQLLPLPFSFCRSLPGIGQSCRNSLPLHCKSTISFLQQTTSQLGLFLSFLPFNKPRHFFLAVHR